MKPVRLKYRATVIAGQAPKGDTVFDMQDGMEGTPFIQGNAEFGDRHPTPRFLAAFPPKRAPKGSILLSVRAPVGALNVSDQEIGIGRGIAAISARASYDQRFLWWALKAAKQDLASRADGSTYDAVSADDIRALRLPDLPLLRQRAVADFLDRECARIAETVSTLVAQMASLDEYREDIVRRAVAGLRSRPLKYGFSVVDCKHRTPDYLLEGYPVISTREVTRGHLDLAQVDRFVGAADYADMRGGQRDPLPGDIIYSRNASLGNAAYVSGALEICMGQDVVLITRRPRDCELLTYVLNYAVADQVARLSVGSTFSRINVPVIRSLVVPYDEASVEGARAAAIRREFGVLDTAEAELRLLCAELATYRNALITEAVTGHLDVCKVSDAQMDESARAAMEGERPEVLLA